MQAYRTLVAPQRLIGFSFVAVLATAGAMRWLLAYPTPRWDAGDAGEGWTVYRRRR